MFNLLVNWNCGCPVDLFSLLKFGVSALLGKLSTTYFFWILHYFSHCFISNINVITDRRSRDGTVASDNPVPGEEEQPDRLECARRAQVRHDRRDNSWLLAISAQVTGYQSKLAVLLCVVLGLIAFSLLYWLYCNFESLWCLCIFSQLASAEFSQSYSALFHSAAAMRRSWKLIWSLCASAGCLSADAWSTSWLSIRTQSTSLVSSVVDLLAFWWCRCVIDCIRCWYDRRANDICGYSDGALSHLDLWGGGNRVVGQHAQIGERCYVVWFVACP